MLVKAVADHGLKTDLIGVLKPSRIEVWVYRSEPLSRAFYEKSEPGSMGR
jgi:hypothetical protein